MKISPLQAKIIDLLTIQQEIKFSKVAKTLKISQPLLSHHIQTLQKNNIIQRFNIVLNQNNQKQTYLTLLKLNGNKDQFIKDIQEKIPHFKRLIQTFGDYDFLIAKKLHTPSQHQMMLKNLYNATTTIQTHQTIIETAGVIYNTQLSNTIKRSKIQYYDVAFPNPEKEILKMAIIKELKKDILISQLNLAKKVDVSYPTLRIHVQELRKKKVIIGERCRINFDTLGFAQYYFFLKIIPSAMPTLYTFTEQNPAITRFSECIGDHNAVFELITKNDQETELILTQLRQTLTSNLTSYKILHKTKEIMINPK